MKVSHCLILIILAGLSLRFYGINFGLPYLYHPDESILIEKALSFGTGDFNPHYFEWPASIIMYLLFVVYGIYYLVLLIMGTVDTPLEFSQLFWNDPTVFYVIARTMVAVAGAATIYVTYRIASEVYGKKEGIISAIIIAFSYYHIRNSHYAAVDVPMVLLMLISVLYFNRYAKNNSTKKLIIASAFWGLATAVKFSAAYIFFVLCFAVWLSTEKNCKRSLSNIAKTILLSSFIAVSVFFVVTPYALLDFQTCYQHIMFQIEHVKGVHLGFAAEYSSYLWFFIEILPKMAGLLMAILFVFGIVYCVVERKKETLLLLGNCPIHSWRLFRGKKMVVTPNRI